MQILLDFQRRKGYNFIMFQLFKRSLYQALLDAESDARQIRSPRNRVIAGNGRGNELFGTGAAPFGFLADAEDASVREKIAEAYLTGAPYAAEIKTPQALYEVRLQKVGNDLLLIAADKTPAYANERRLTRQLALIEGIVSDLVQPLYLIDAKGAVAYANKAFCRLFKTAAAELIGRNIRSFIGDNAAGALEKIVRLPEGSSYQISQFPLSSADAGLTCGLLQKLPPPEISPQELCHKIPVPCALIDRKEHRLTEANAPLCELLEKGQEQLKGLPFAALFPEAARAGLTRKIEKALAGGEPTQTELLTLPSFGEKTLTLFIGAATAEQNELPLYAIDVSARKNLEIQVAHAQKMQAMGQMAGGIAHDFNNLLTAIIGFTDLLLQKASDESYADLMQIKGNAQKAGALIGQLLTFSRKQPAQVRLIPAAEAFADLSALLQRTLAPFCTLKTEFKNNLGAVRFDPNQLTQIFLNLAVNAKDAMPEGGTFKLVAEREKVKKSRPCGNDILPVGDYIKVIASDTGCGIESKHLPHIFEPFFTTKGSGGGSGTGLGLSTVYGIVRSGNGFIAVDSIPDVGTTFTLYLPRFESADKATAAAPAEQAPFRLRRPATILLVDDEASVRTVTARALKTSGFEVIACANAAEALVHLKERGDISLIITDMVMPGMDGETLTREAQKIHAAIKSILISGYSEAFARHGSEQHSGFVFLPKPFELAQLLKKVQELLENAP